MPLWRSLTGFSRLPFLGAKNSCILLSYIQYWLTARRNSRFCFASCKRRQYVQRLVSGSSPGAEWLAYTLSTVLGLPNKRPPQFRTGIPRFRMMRRLKRECITTSRIRNRFKISPSSVYAQLRMTDERIMEVPGFKSAKRGGERHVISSAMAAATREPNLPGFLASDLDISSGEALGCKRWGSITLIRTTIPRFESHNWIGEKRQIAYSWIMDYTVTCHCYKL
jgi:hypothetical protein